MTEKTTNASATYKTRWLVGYRHFSPLFIGEVFEASERDWTLLLVTFLSVPSSSGKCLKLTPELWEKSSIATFSPLFIGEVFEASECGRGIGSLCQSFSPLFIGEVFEADEDRETALLDHHFFQSPLHRGSV